MIKKWNEKNMKETKRIRKKYVKMSVFTWPRVETSGGVL